jgi:hypothetical protein
MLKGQAPEGGKIAAPTLLYSEIAANIRISPEKWQLPPVAAS